MGMRLLLLTLLLTLFSASQAAAHQERYHVRSLCKDMRQEKVNSDRTRIDCLHPVFAIEVDFSHKWAEGIGQALYYSSLWNRRPGLILICGHGAKDKTCRKHLARAVETLKTNQIDSMIWYCENKDRRLALCESTRLEYASRFSSSDPDGPT